MRIVYCAHCVGRRLLKTVLFFHKIMWQGRKDIQAFNPDQVKTMNVTFWAPEGNIVQMECPLGIQFYFSFLMSKIANHKIVRQTFMLDDSNRTISTLIGIIIRPSEEVPIEVWVTTILFTRLTNGLVYFCEDIKCNNNENFKSCMVFLIPLLLAFKRKPHNRYLAYCLLIQNNRTFSQRFSKVALEVEFGRKISSQMSRCPGP